MIDRVVFTKEYILNYKKSHNVDPQILERAIYALGLVEAMVNAGASFIFKGGSSLMILMDKPKRLSTDVDIIVSPNTDIIQYIENASKIYPFIRYKEDIRNASSDIIKRHFVFYYESLYNAGKETAILLDVLFEDNHYANVAKKEIKTSFLLTSGEKTYVNVPTIESLLGDKLTAFAPKTIGVKPLEVKAKGKTIDKRIEVVKQFFDIATLYDYMSNVSEVIDSYYNVSKSELIYRGLGIDSIECLKDTFEAALSIITKGKYMPADYQYYLDGIRRIGGFLIETRFSAESAFVQASKVMHLASIVVSKGNYEDEFDDNLLLNKPYYRIINSIRKMDLASYNRAVAAINTFEKYKK